MNEVDNLLKTPFLRLSVQEKHEVKRLGPHQPKYMPIIQTSSASSGSVKRKRVFNANTWYKRKPWLTVSLSKKSIFCFPCLLFGTEREEAWTKHGVTDIKHLSEKITKHESSSKHISNKLQLETFGDVIIFPSLIEGDSSVIRHNQDVNKNRHVLKEIISCLKFCAAHELPIRGHAESSDSFKPDVFLGLVNLIGRLDSQLAYHLEHATVFKGTGHQIQNELLDCMFSVYREEISKEIQKAWFVSIQADDTSDVSCFTQSVIILRYVKKKEIVERFHGFLQPLETTAVGISNMILGEIEPYNIKEKLIAQTYDGAVMGGVRSGMQVMIREQYPIAVFIHCYAHGINLVMQQVASSVNVIKVFFANLSGFPTFFSTSPKRTSALYTVTSQRVDRGSATRCNFRSRTVNSIFEMKDDLKECFSNIINGHGWDTISISEASSLKRWLEDSTFLFFLDIFRQVFSHTELLFAILLRNSSVSLVCNAVTKCVIGIQSVRDEIDTIALKYLENSTSCDVNRIAAKEACDLMCNQLCDRFSSLEYVQSFKLIDPSRFSDFRSDFPEEYLVIACRNYQMLIKEKLRTELKIVYKNDVFTPIKTVLALHAFFIDHNLAETFSEVFKLLQITLTTPVSSTEAERCFSTVKRIKTWLRNSIGHNRLNALAMLTIHTEFITAMEGFDDKVIEAFARLENRQMDFLHK